MGKDESRHGPTQMCSMIEVKRSGMNGDMLMMIPRLSCKSKRCVRGDVYIYVV